MQELCSTHAYIISYSGSFLTASSSSRCICCNSACFMLHTGVGLVVVVLQKQASKARLVPFGIETLETQAQTLSLSLLCSRAIQSESFLR